MAYNICHQNVRRYRTEISERERVEKIASRPVGLVVIENSQDCI